MKQVHYREHQIRWIVTVVAITLMGSGMINGEVKTVLAKAINICLECIGIG